MKINIGIGKQHHNPLTQQHKSKEDFLRNKAFSQYALYGHTLAQEPLPRGL